MTAQLTPEQIQQYIAAMQQAAPAPAAAPAAASPALPGFEGFDELEVTENSRQMYQFLGRFQGTVNRIEVGETSEQSEKGKRPKFILEAEVTASTHDGLPVGSSVAFVKTGGTGTAARYYQEGVKKCMGALLGVEANEVTLQHVAHAASEAQPYTNRSVGWEVFEHTSKRTGKTSSVVRFFHISE